MADKETDTTMAAQKEAIALVTKIMADANALSVKLQGQLAEARSVLEVLRPAQHDLIRIETKYQRFSDDKSHMNPLEIIDVEIKRINAALGDRA